MVDNYNSIVPNMDGFAPLALYENKTTKEKDPATKGSGKGNPNHDEKGRFASSPSGGAAASSSDVDLKARGKKKGTAYKSYSTDGKNVVAEWLETEHPIYKGEAIIMSKDQIGMTSSTKGNQGIAKKAYDVRDKRLRNPFEVFEPIDDAEEKYVRDHIKKQFDIDDKQLDKLLER